LTILTADKGFDWELLRQKLRSEGVKPVIKHRKFGWHGVANNGLLDDTTYYQRSYIEATFFALRRKYCEIVRARTWFGQFRELVLTCAVRNIELALAGNRQSLGRPARISPFCRFARELRGGDRSSLNGG
jgi:IS5 family transposase